MQNIGIMVTNTCTRPKSKHVITFWNADWIYFSIFNHKTKILFELAEYTLKSDSNIDMKPNVLMKKLLAVYPIIW